MLGKVNNDTYYRTHRMHNVLAIKSQANLCSALGLSSQVHALLLYCVWLSPYYYFPTSGDFSSIMSLTWFTTSTTKSRHIVQQKPKVQLNWFVLTVQLHFQTCPNTLSYLKRWSGGRSTKPTDGHSSENHRNNYIVRNHYNTKWKCNRWLFSLYPPNWTTTTYAQYHRFFAMTYHLLPFNFL